MRFADVLGTGMLGLRTRKLRAALSALGIAIGIAAMVAVLGVSASSRADLLAEIDSLGTNLLKVTAGQSFIGEDDVKLSGAAPAMIGRAEGVERVVAVTGVDATVRRTDKIPEEETGGLAVVATEPSLLATLAGRLRSGRFLDAATSHFPAVVLGADAAKTLGIDRPGLRVWIGGRWFSVIGILEPLGLAPDLDASAMIGERIARSRLDAGTAPSTIYVRVDDGRVEAARSILAATASPQRPEEANVSRPSDALEAKAAVDTAFTSLLLGLGAVALLVGGVGIANVMVVSVLERRGEVGLRRALGATKGAIGSQFLCESLVLAAFGGVAGSALGAAVTAGYATTRGWSFDVPLWALAAGVGAAAAIGTLAGLYPALRAARMAPTDALRTA